MDTITQLDLIVLHNTLMPTSRVATYPGAQVTTSIGHHGKVPLQ